MQATLNGGARDKSMYEQMDETKRITRYYFIVPLQLAQKRESVSFNTMKLLNVTRNQCIAA